MHCHIITTPVGPLKIIFDSKNILSFSFDTALSQNVLNNNPHFIHSVEKKINDYFSGTYRDVTEAPFDECGTPFQKLVWRTMRTIPFGETRTYGELAKTLGSHPRAVGQACRKNPFPILTPCHRVVAKDSLGGFVGEVSGNMTEIKSKLIHFERTFL